MHEEREHVSNWEDAGWWKVLPGANKEAVLQALRSAPIRCGKQIRWTGALLAASGRGSHGDRSEECFFNFLSACWTRDMQKYTYFSRLNNHANMPGQSYVPIQGTLCCLGQMLKAMTHFVQNMWMATWDNGLAWTYYGPCSMRAKVGAGDGTLVSLKSETAYPFGESIALAVEPERPVTFPLRLRVPRWCDGFAVKVNGAAVDAKPDDSGFVELRREWKAGDRVEIQLPMKPQVHVARELEGAPFAAVHYGPLCMTLPLEKPDETYDPAAEWKFAIDAPEGAEKGWKVERSPMPAHWDWPLAAPLLEAAAPCAVALYGEFPYTDTTTQFYDSAIHYYFHRGGGQAYSPIFDAESSRGTDTVALNLYRFLFPKLMHLDLPLGTAYDTWHPLKFTFFNGEAIYDSFWQLEESRGHAFMVRAYELKKRFKDCFTSDTPEMLVPTDRANVYANCFPGKGRTLWTLYNARPTTVRGTILAVPHQDGAAYRDQWNDKELKAEIRDGKAILSLELGPQSIGCITQTLQTP